MSKKGKPSPNKGKPMSEEQKQKLIAANKGRKLTQEHRNKLSLKHLGKHWKLVDGKRVYY